MQTLYSNCNKEIIDTDIDIDVTFYEQWLGLKSSLPDKIIVENLLELFGSEYQANDSIKKLYLQEQNKIDIFKLLDESLFDDFSFFSKIISADRKTVNEFLENARKHEQLTIENIVWPFIYYSLYKEKDFINKLLPSHIDTFVELITKGILNIAIKNHILDMNMHEKYLFYKEESTYSEFIRNEILNFDFFERFYTKNPILLSRCFSKTHNLILYFKEVITNLSLDFDIHSITRLSFSEGDTHAGGKTVVKFTEGSKNYYYKPRNLFVEKVYYDILDMFNIPHINYSNNKYYESYSIIEEVSYLPVNEIDEIKDYYYSLGQLQFVLYLLGGSDIHYENIIANGKMPAIIDLETLFQINYDHIKCDSNVVRKRFENQLDLLQNIGILDLYLPGEGKGMNVSALFGKGSKKVVQKEIFKNINTMDLLVENAYLDNVDRQNIPFLKNGKSIEVNKFLCNFLSGFIDISNLFLNKKDEVVSYLEKLSISLVVRNVLRPTFVYVDFLFYSTHPIYLTNLVRYNKLLENLFGIEFNNKKINLSEIYDITHDDVPIFFSCIGKKNIYDSRGKNLGESWIYSPLEKVIHRINQLNADKIEDLILNLKICLSQRVDINCLSKDYIFNKLNNEGIFFNSSLITVDNELIYSTLDTTIRSGIIGLWYYLKLQDKEFIQYVKEIEDFIENDFINYTGFVDLKHAFAYYVVRYVKFNEIGVFENISRILGKNNKVYEELDEEIKNYNKITVDCEYFNTISSFEYEILDAINIFRKRGD